MASVIILGAGAMGLAAAHHALKAGHDVTVVEADAQPGGMAAHFDFDGVSIERFYHFICKPDTPTFTLCEELGIGDKLRWRDTSMGYFIKGQHHRWGDPVSLLRFPHLTLLEKLRFGAAMFFATRRNDWKPLDALSAKDWFIDKCGERAWNLLWKPLFELKFFEYSDRVSAAWIWSRIKRLGNSRKSLFQEQLGYLEGGSETLVDALVASIHNQGGTLHLGDPVTEVLANDGHVTGVQTRGTRIAADAVISTVPTPFISQLVPMLTDTEKGAYEAIENIGVVCVVLKLRQKVTDHFWVNICDDAIEFPGIVEFSNLRPTPEPIVYLPYYMPTSHPRFTRSDEEIVDESMAAIRRLNPQIRQADLLASKVGRLRYAQPVCDVGFSEKIPPLKTSIRGLQIADTCFYYPEDRGISESVRLGRIMAENLP